MSIEGSWASPDDFATLFQYLWHRDFPVSEMHLGARRADWTIHIGVVVRNIADIMGLYARFETGKRTDAVIRTNAGQDVIALEWEWGGIGGNELAKLKDRASNKPLRYCVLVTYTHTPNIQWVYDRVNDQWRDAKCPLLLVLIDFADSRKFWSRREFKRIQMSVFYEGEQRELRTAPALPWEVEGTRWAKEPR